LDQVLDAVDHGEVEAGQWAGVVVKPLLLDSVNQILALQPELFG
jgi:hypothetical protein